MTRALGVRLFLWSAGMLPVAAISAQVAEVASMCTVARFVVFPMSVGALLIMALSRSGESRAAFDGLVAGIVAVLAYDALRLPLCFIGAFPDFIPQVGGWVMGSDGANPVIGYLYRYIGDGGGMGLAYGVLLSAFRWERRPVRTGIVYGTCIWLCLMATVALTARGCELLFVPSLSNAFWGFMGHLIYGGVLGAMVYRLRLRRITRERLRPSSPASVVAA